MSSGESMDKGVAEMIKAMQDLESCIADDVKGLGDRPDTVFGCKISQYYPPMPHGKVLPKFTEDGHYTEEFLAEKVSQELSIAAGEKYVTDISLRLREVRQKGEKSLGFQLVREVTKKNNAYAILKTFYEGVFLEKMDKEREKRSISFHRNNRLIGIYKDVPEPECGERFDDYANKIVALHKDKFQEELDKIDEMEKLWIAAMIVKKTGGLTTGAIVDQAMAEMEKEKAEAALKYNTEMIVMAAAGGGTPISLYETEFAKNVPDYGYSLRTLGKEMEFIEKMEAKKLASRPEKVELSNLPFDASGAPPPTENGFFHKIKKLFG